MAYAGTFKDEVPLDDIDYRIAGDTAQAIARVSGYTPGTGPISPGPSFKGATQGDILGYVKPPYSPPPESVLDRFQTNPVPDYVRVKGFQAAHDAWECGNDLKHRRWVVPIRREDGSLLGFTSRLYWDEDHCFRCGRNLMEPNKLGVIRRIHKCHDCHQIYAKWLHTSGIPRNDVVFGIHKYENGNPVVMVEGPSDALRLWQHGVRCPMATLGSNVDDHQIEILVDKVGHGPTYYLMGDGDKAGRIFNETIAVMLAMEGCVSKTVLLEEETDPGGLTEEQVRQLLPAECFADAG